jgi:hypothetical protein
MRIPALAIGACLVLSAISVAGQDTAAAMRGQDTASAGAQELAQYVTQRLTSELDLTAEQIPRVQALNVASATELEQLVDRYDKDTTAAGDSALVDGAVTTIQNHQAELKKLLTPEQWAQHQRNKAKRLALAHTEVMAYDLELTSAQVPEVERINLASADRLVTALQALQVANPSRDQIREAARPILQERDGQLRRVLTASQWDELQQNRRTLQNLYAQQVASDSTTPKPKP